MLSSNSRQACWRRVKFAVSILSRLMSAVSASKDAALGDQQVCGQIMAARRYHLRFWGLKSAMVHHESISDSAPVAATALSGEAAIGVTLPINKLTSLNQKQLRAGNEITSKPERLDESNRRFCSYRDGRRRCKTVTSKNGWERLKKNAGQRTATGGVEYPMAV